MRQSSVPLNIPHGRTTVMPTQVNRREIKKKEDEEKNSSKAN